MGKMKGLGRGLSALIPEAELASAHGVIFLATDQIHPNPYQPRREFTLEELKDLAASVAQVGVLQPLLVFHREGKYILLAGERRLRAAIMAGLKEVPVRLIEVSSDREILLISLIENLQREDLNPLELAQGYQDLMERFSLTQEETARLVGKDRSTIANTIRLLSLPEKVKSALVRGEISAGHCRAILSLPTEELQLKLFDLILHNALSVRQAERIAKQLALKTSQKSTSRNREVLVFKDYQEMLRRHLGTRVKVELRGKKGVITIHFTSPEELESIIEKMTNKL